MCARQAHVLQIYSLPVLLENILQNIPQRYNATLFGVVNEQKPIKRHRAGRGRQSD